MKSKQSNKPDSIFYQTHEIMMLYKHKTDDELIELIEKKCNISTEKAEEYFDAVLLAMYENRI